MLPHDSVEWTCWLILSVITRLGHTYPLSCGSILPSRTVRTCQTLKRKQTSLSFYTLQILNQFNVTVEPVGLWTLFNKEKSLCGDFRLIIKLTSTPGSPGKPGFPGPPDIPAFPLGPYTKTRQSTRKVYWGKYRRVCHSSRLDLLEYLLISPAVQQVRLCPVYNMNKLLHFNTNISISFISSLLCS